MPRTFHKTSAKLRLIIAVILAAGAFTFCFPQRAATVAAAAPQACAGVNFGSAKIFSTEAAYFAATGNFNKDGKPDLAVANNTVFSGLSILLGDGAGGFTAGNNFQQSVRFTSVAIADSTRRSEQHSHRPSRISRLRRF